jgi:L-seryl-tRNA(Ser) seleniumtransferase
MREAPPGELLPSVDSLLNEPAFAALCHEHGRTAVRDALREHLQARRARWLAGDQPLSDEGAGMAAAVAEAIRLQSAPSLRSVHNLTGTVLHTNLGRAWLAEAAAAAAWRAATGPCTLEYDLERGVRGERDAHVEPLIARLTGAESALVVNNNAAAVLLLLNSLANRRRVIVSRGELVEIGGQFRIPDIMKRAGARLVEVGTTNRTHARDYVEALAQPAALVMKVHTSNYRIEGFTHSVGESEIAAIARRAGVASASDLGSGTLVDLRRWGLPHERTVQEVIASGIDLVTFSGDKLLGGPQCGIVAGRRDLVEQLRRNPLRRALRVDKMTIAALEQVLRLYETRGDDIAAHVPTLRLLSRPAEEILALAQRVAPAIAAVVPSRFEVSVAACMSQVGSGALPVETLPSHAVRIRSSTARRERQADLDALHAAFRRLPVPVVGRIDRDALMLDCRCLTDEAGFVRQLVAADGFGR